MWKANNKDLSFWNASSPPIFSFLYIFYTFFFNLYIDLLQGTLTNWYQNMILDHYKHLVLFNNE